MERLTRAASSVYLQCTSIMFDCGQIPWTIFIERMHFLHKCSSANDPSGIYALRVLSIEQLESDDEWHYEQSSENETTSDSGEISEPSRFVDDDDHILSFLVTGIPELAKWYFHLADPDYFPSIPHGHESRKNQPKLDSYLGWVYRNSKQIRREKRDTIVKLWNDKKFRVFAQDAIDYYLATYPSYTGWRVKNPRRLPRRRSP